MVEGEVASATYHTSGHLYFSIKDKDSSVKCVMWRSSVAKMKFRIEKGMHIVVEGSVSVYTPRGEYQFQTVRIEPFGQGALALAYEQLKEKLKGKGYFDAERKKPIPKHIAKIALVTAKDSAALHDMLKIIEHRWAMVEVTIIDTLVQGDAAAGQISRALHYADSLNVDVVVVGRGGGSSEDLWSFNEEMVADAIFTMKTPVVSAVGHEVDILISDFVADLRAPTPSAAMEMIFLDSGEILYALSEMQERFSYVIEQKLQRSERDLKYSEEILLRASPLRLLSDIELEFKRLKDEYRRTYEYRQERFNSNIQELRKSYAQTMALALQYKEQQLSLLVQNISLYDPKLQCKSGWAQVSIDNKSVNLTQVNEKEIFVLQDANTRIEALCLQKK
jgi:exodeoxyribonuclease VII large subunit